MFGLCCRCGQPATVGLNGRDYCQEHFSEMCDQLQKEAAEEKVQGAAKRATLAERQRKAELFDELVATVEDLSTRLHAYICDLDGQEVANNHGALAAARALLARASTKEPARDD